MKKVISIFLITVFMMQSCVVYQKIPVALDNAVEKGNVKVITTSDEELKFREILSMNDSIYLGVINENETLSLNEELIYRIYLKNDAGSDIATIALVLLITFSGLTIVGMIALANYYSDWSL